MKVCSRCKVRQKRQEFNRDKTRKDGLSYWCKSCIQKKNKAAKPVRDKIRRTTTNEMTEFIRALKNSTPCTDCGRHFPYYVMDFDHLRDKKFSIAKRTGTTSFEKLKEEIEKCEIVCANCHRERTHQRLL